MSAAQSPPGSPAREPVRCPWAGIADAGYARYHDEEWGVPKTGDRELFEKLVLEGFQAGLSWLTILRKREAFRRAFAGFEPARLARFASSDVERLMMDPGIVRNRSKITAAIDNAQAFLRLEKEEGGLAAFVWGFIAHKPIINRPRAMADIPASTDLSVRLSKALRERGFRFVGPTTVYAFMQASGLVNDHLVSCHRHRPCAELQRALGARAGSVRPAR